MWWISCVVFAYLLVCLGYSLLQERLIFVAGRKLKRDAKIGLDAEFEEEFLQVNFGGEIHYIHIKTPHPKGAILYFHGNTGNVNRWGEIAKPLTRFGMDVYLPDYRGYGKSTGERSQEILFADAVAMFDKLAETIDPELIFVYGRSLGSAFATHVGSCRSCAGVVLETPFSNMLDVAYHHSLHLVPMKWLLRYPLRNDLKIKLVESPVLMIHGTKDRLVPYKCSRALYRQAEMSGNVSFLTIPGGGHGNLADFPEMERELAQFFSKNLRK